MNQSQKRLLIATVIVFFILLPSWFGHRMSQQRQQRQRAAAERRRHQEQARKQRRQQTPDSQGVGEGSKAPSKVPAAALAEFRATVGHAFDALRGQGIVAEPKFEEAVDGQVGKPAPRDDPPRVRLERVGHLPGEPGDPIPDMVVAGNYAYVTQHDELRVIDVSDPTRPCVVGILGFEDPATVRSISGQHLYGASGRLLFVDVSDPSAPRVASSCKLGFPTCGVAV
jgi:hypothetical protein